MAWDSLSLLDSIKVSNCKHLKFLGPRRAIWTKEKEQKNVLWVIHWPVCQSEHLREKSAILPLLLRRVEVEMES